MKCKVISLDLQLINRFVVAGGSASVKRNSLFVLEDVGLGEAAGSVHYGATPEQIENELKEICTIIHSGNINIPDFLIDVNDRYCEPVICAVSTAWYDYLGKINKTSISAELDLGQPKMIPTSITVSIGDKKSLEAHIAAGYKYIKLKMDAINPQIYKMIEIINKYNDLKVRIDANGSWNLVIANEILSKFKNDAVEFIEQPFDADADDFWREFKNISNIPVIIDESIISVKDVERVAEYVDGINIKIQKSGRLETAVVAMRYAKQFGLKVLLGCMIESSVGIAAAYSLSSLADYIDLDGRLLIEIDPFTGLTYNNGFLTISGMYGHGITLA